MASETSIQENILDYINSLPYGVAENVSGNAKQSGRADINACVYGFTLKIEVKTEDTAYGRKGATTKQRLYLEKWARAGAFSCVVYSVDDVKYCIGMLLRKHSFFSVTKDFQLSGRGKWYDVQNKRWVDISY
jgi:hypothetical protein